MFTLSLDKSGKIPLYEQLYRFIRSEIEGGRLSPLEKLPSKRKLAAHLKISTVTVEAAYAQLAAEGYVRSAAKSGYYVESFNRGVFGFTPIQKTTSPIKPEASRNYPFDFRTNVVDTALFPFSTWAKLAREVLSEGGDAVLNAVHPQGAPELRSEIARYLHDYRGLATHPDNIIVGAGSEYLLSLLVQLLGRDKAVALENPGYPKVRTILQNYGAQTVPVPVDEQGLSVEELSRAGAQVVHVTPSHQFPTGSVMPVGRRLALLQWAGKQEGRFILEDDYDSEFRFSGNPIPALQGYDRQGCVIYLNAFTKSLAPSLRISYAVLPDSLLARFREQFSYYSGTVPGFEQYTLAKFMKGGAFERHLSRMRTVYRERRDVFMRTMSASGLKVQFIGADSGLHLLLLLENGLTEHEMVERAKERGVRVYGLSSYLFEGKGEIPKSTVVVGYSGMEPERIRAAAELLVKAWSL